VRVLFTLHAVVGKPLRPAARTARDRPHAHRQQPARRARLLPRLIPHLTPPPTASTMTASMTAPTTARTDVHGLQVATTLHRFIEEQVLPRTGIDAAAFWL